ncbi:MAG: hypothetical protein KAY37_02085 [Phycisphaerae bacterium]|nr:hypothetical protein [Phycisphaerae bacterium]
MKPKRGSLKRSTGSLLVGFALVAVLGTFPPETAGQIVQLHTDDFTLWLDDDSRMTGCTYFPPPPLLPMAVPPYTYPTNIANTEPGATWDFTDSLTAVEVTPGVQDLTYVYSTVKSSTMRVTEHPHFLEFNLTEVQGDCGRIRTFGPNFLGLREFNESTYGRRQCLALHSGLYACLIAGNVETRVLQYRSLANEFEMIYTQSYEYLPKPDDPHVRAHQFAFFICNSADLQDRIAEVEAHFNIPGGMPAKDHPANNYDYLFLLNRNDASAEEVAELCHSMRLGAVLLVSGIWCDWDDPYIRWELQPGIKEFVATLQSQGLVVGVHTYVHKVAANGYYALTYPESFSDFAVNGRKNFLYTDSRPEQVASDFADAVVQVGAEWLYFDGAENLTVADGEFTSTYDWYVKSRMTRAIMSELEARGVVPVIHQQSSYGDNCYHHVTRGGQTDYWEDPAGCWDDTSIYHNPIQSMDIRAPVAPFRRIVGLGSDLGWFGRIHVSLTCDPFTYEDRYATMEEWTHLCDKSLEYDIPIGIRTGYQYWLDDPDRDTIEQMVYATVVTRRSLGEGDFDMDSDVDLRDFAAFQRCFGQPTGGGCAPGDLNGDAGQIDWQDFILFAALMKGP